ncbi:hypothetical protein [Dyadobacter luticola]|uniref:Uncharacterized protein n=1 Tax=Dyadobacter luticola TaxID=1979387 RepID=A0A5R9L584_9BACT|nr:hypothetical protein [Dyadobacter luticola]TLV03529.1 hypothetical protein FEN17_07975 [Dyadobacter luticola]
MLKIVANYKELRQNIGMLIKHSGYKNSYIAEKLGIPSPNFSVKKKRGSWTIEEVEKILAIIDNEELEDFYLGKVMEKVEKEKDFVTLDELKKEMGWK